MTSEHHVRIARNENGSHVVAVDGHEVQDAAEALNLSMAAGKLPVLRLHLHTVVPDITTRARVLLDATAAEALQAMGWTPPPDGGH